MDNDNEDQEFEQYFTNRLNESKEDEHFNL